MNYVKYCFIFYKFNYFTKGKRRSFYNRFIFETSIFIYIL